MAVIATRPITVLDTPEIQIDENREFARAVLQVYTGKGGIAGQMTVYTSEEDYKHPKDLQAMSKGDYEVDIEEVHERFGNVGLRYSRPRLAGSKQPKRENKFES